MDNHQANVGLAYRHGAIYHYASTSPSRAAIHHTGEHHSGTTTSVGAKMATNTRGTPRHGFSHTRRTRRLQSSPSGTTNTQRDPGAHPSIIARSSHTGRLQMARKVPARLSYPTTRIGSTTTVLVWHNGCKRTRHGRHHFSTRF
jgi:hypothetical protein